jgi:hypothetical protein
LLLEPFVEAFSATFGVPLSDIKIANDEALDHTTIHDDHGGVQWMYLQDWQAGRGSVVLNLEGLEYDGWPIARLLERELASAAFLYQQQCNLPVAHYRELRRTIALPLIASERPSVEA